MLFAVWACYAVISVRHGTEKLSNTQKDRRSSILSMSSSSVAYYEFGLKVSISKSWRCGMAPMRSARMDHSDSHFVSCGEGHEASRGMVGASVRRLLTTPSLVPNGLCRPSGHEPIPTRGSGIDRQCRSRVARDDSGRSFTSGAPVNYRRPGLTSAARRCPSRLPSWSPR